MTSHPKHHAVDPSDLTQHLEPMLPKIRTAAETLQDLGNILWHPCLPLNCELFICQWNDKNSFVKCMVLRLESSRLK